MNTPSSIPRLKSLRRKAQLLDDLPPEELRKLFPPDPRIQEVLKYAKGSVNRIALFYHAAYLEAFGQTPPYAPIPGALVGHIAEILGEITPATLPYPDARATFFHHAEKARRVMAWRLWDKPTRRGLEHRLTAEARRSDDPDYLREKLDGWLWEARILCPGPTRVEQMIGQARNSARDWISGTIVSALSKEQIGDIDGLRKIKAGMHRTFLQWLKDPLGLASPRTLDDILDRIVFIRSLGLSGSPFEKIHPDMRRRLMQTVEAYSVDNLYADFPTERRQALVACYVHERLKALIDLAVEAFDGIVLKMNRHSEADLARDQQERGPAINEKLLMFRTMARIMVDEEHVPDLDVRPTTYGKIPKEDLLRALAEAEDLIRPEDYNCFDYLKTRYSYLRSFFPYFLEVMEFEGVPSARPVLETVAALRGWNAQGLRKLPAEVPLDFVPAKWRPYVCPEPGKIDRHYYELCLMTALHEGLKSAELWAVGGRRYGNVEDLLISKETWNQIHDECCEELALPKDPKTWLAQVLPTLRKQIEITTRNLPGNPQTQIVSDRVHLKAIEAVPESDALKALRARVAASWPQTRIQDLLVEVDSWMGYTHLFRTPRGRKGTEQGFSRGLLAALIAKGCNIGMLKMSVLTPGVTQGTLRRVDETYLREETLRHAYEALLRGHRDLPIARLLGEDTISMSDGFQVGSRVGTLRAALKPHRFAPGERAITYYWHLSHLGPAYGAQVIGHDRDAAYLLDQIFHIQSELPIHEHFADTHGSNSLTFALAYLSRLAFSPRIKLIHDQDLHFPPGMAVEGPFKSHFEGPIDVELIEKHWDDILRVLASIRRGYTSAVLLTLRLSSYARQNPLFRALQEVGRIFKTRFIMQYCDEPALRRKINAGLNRMELFNYLARHLFFARRGENWERDFDRQLNRASALLVLANACVLWNAVHLTEFVQKLRAEGIEVPPEDFRHISLYAHEHIVPYGEYTFSLKNRDRQDAYLNARQL